MLCAACWRCSYEGLSDDAGEKAQIGRDIGDSACVLIMRNHGYCCVGATVGEVRAHVRTVRGRLSSRAAYS